MVWSEQIGDSITLPSDWSPGDTRNHMTIGQDVPAEIAARFSAVLSWWNGSYTGNPDADFPNGYKYWALGISNIGALELVAYYYSVSAPTGGGYTYYRRTLFSVCMPPDSSGAPVLSLGNNPNYGSYSEGFNVIASTQINALVPKTLLTYDNPTIFTTWDAGGVGSENAFYEKDVTGRVSLGGLVKSVTAGGWSAGTSWFTLPVGCRPAADRYFVVPTQQNTQGLFLLKLTAATGRITWAGNPGAAMTYITNTWVSLDGISFKAEQ